MGISSSRATSPISRETLLTQLQWRYATKKFDPSRKISPADWEALEQVLVLSPSSFGLQPWKFFVVDDPKLRQQLKAVSFNQPQITDAAALVVFALKKDLSVTDVEHYFRRIAQVRQVPVESLKGYKDVVLGFVTQASKGLDIDVWSARQIYIALGNFLTSAAALGIDACPMEGITHGKYDEILGLSAKGYHTLVVATAGYRAIDDTYALLPKVRYERAEVLEHL